MKKLFLAIRHRDLGEVQTIVAGNPTLVNCVAKQPPKKDDGQSPLQVAFKTGNFDIADFLMDAGADVNYYDSGSINAWKAPVIHDAITAAVGSCLHVPDANETSFVDQALVSLRKIIERGANIEAEDSYGNNCAMRFALDAKQYCPPEDHKAFPPYIENLASVLDLLLNTGVDFDSSTATRSAPSSSMRKDSPIYALLSRQKAKRNLA